MHRHTTRRAPRPLRIAPKGYRKWHPKRKRLQIRWGNDDPRVPWDPKTLWAAHVTHYGKICLNGVLRSKEAHDFRYEILAHEIMHAAGFKELDHPVMERFERRLGQLLHDLLLSPALPPCGCSSGPDVGV